MKGRAELLRVWVYNVVVSSRALQYFLGTFEMQNLESQASCALEIQTLRIFYGVCVLEALCPSSVLEIFSRCSVSFVENFLSFHQQWH